MTCGGRRIVRPQRRPVIHRHRRASTATVAGCSLRPDPCAEPEVVGPWRRRSRVTTYANPWIEVFHDEVDRPDGSPGIYGVVHFRTAAVGVVAVDDDGRLLLVGQHRYALDEYSWEIPEGGVGEDEPLVDGARRELREETGFDATDWRQLCRMTVSNSVTDERGAIFVATGLRPGSREARCDRGPGDPLGDAPRGPGGDRVGRDPRPDDDRGRRRVRGGRRRCGMSDTVDPGVTTTTPPSPAAFHYGAAHLIMHGNAAFFAIFGRRSLGMPAREVMTELPRAAFELMDRVYREGRPLARRLALPDGEHRLVVVPRKDPETGETYGVTTHLRVVGTEVASPLNGGSGNSPRDAFEASLPRAAYVDEAFLDREREGIWWSEWVVAGRVEQLAEPGDFLAVDVAGEQVIVVRNRAGDISAHYDVCRHRGSRLTTPDQRDDPATGDAAGAVRAASRASSAARTTRGATSSTAASATRRSSARRTASSPPSSACTRSPSTRGAAGCS